MQDSAKIRHLLTLGILSFCAGSLSDTSDFTSVGTGRRVLYWVQYLPLFLTCYELTLCKYVVNFIDLLFLIFSLKLSMKPKLWRI